MWEKGKAVVIAAFTALSSWLGILAIPVYVLVLLNIADYATGVYAASFRGEAVSSYKGLNGIAKKIGMWLLVGIGAAVDWLLMYATDAVGLRVPFAFVVASLVAVWLICNEIISVLENIADFGVELPPFLVALVVKLKNAAEEQTRGDDDDDLD